MKNSMFMSKSERQERTDKIWNYALWATVAQSIVYVYTGMFAFEAVKDSWLFVSWGAFCVITTLTCMIRNAIRATK